MAHTRKSEHADCFDQWGGSIEKTSSLNKQSWLVLNEASYPHSISKIEGQRSIATNFTLCAQLNYYMKSALNLNEDSLAEKQKSSNPEPTPF